MNANQTTSTSATSCASPFEIREFPFLFSSLGCLEISYLLCFSCQNQCFAPLSSSLPIYYLAVVAMRSQIKSTALLSWSFWLVQVHTQDVPSILGPLTTWFTPPPSCTRTLRTANTQDAFFAASWSGSSLVNDPACFPSGYSPTKTYFPGVCPYGKSNTC
jgi:hypothetical protein